MSPNTTDTHSLSNQSVREVVNCCFTASFLTNYKKNNGFIPKINFFFLMKLIKNKLKNGFKGQ